MRFTLRSWCLGHESLRKLGLVIFLMRVVVDSGAFVQKTNEKPTSFKSTLVSSLVDNLRKQKLWVIDLKFRKPWTEFQDLQYQVGRIVWEISLCNLVKSI